MTRKRIWEELKQAKANIICIQMYTDKKRAWNRWYNFLIALLSGIGALSYNINELIPVGASIAIGLLTISRPIVPQILQPESELAELDVLHCYYTQYLNKIELIWFNLDKDIKSEKCIMDEFNALKDLECEKEAILNKGIRHISGRFQKKIDTEVNNYINKIYNTSCQNQ